MRFGHVLSTYFLDCVCGRRYIKKREIILVSFSLKILNFETCPLMRFVAILCNCASELSSCHWDLDAVCDCHSNHFEIRSEKKKKPIVLTGYSLALRHCNPFLTSLIVHWARHVSNKGYLYSCKCFKQLTSIATHVISPDQPSLQVFGFDGCQHVINLVIRKADFISMVCVSHYNKIYDVLRSLFQWL